MHSQSIELRGHSRRGTPLVMLLACLGALAGCAGSHQAPATASSEPEPNSVVEKDRQMALSRESPAPMPEQPPPADPVTARQDQKVIDHTAATSERLADQTAAHTKNAQDRNAMPAGTPRAAENKAADNKPAQPAADTTPDDQHAANNTGKNKRDRNDATLTPMDQSNAPADRDLTAKIRRAVIDADGLSFTARNVKIVTTDGQVTLRGPVKTPAEKARVEDLARKAAGNVRVVSQLEVEQ